MKNEAAYDCKKKRKDYLEIFEDKNFNLFFF